MIKDAAIRHLEGRNESVMCHAVPDDTKSSLHGERLVLSSLCFITLAHAFLYYPHIKSWEKKVVLL